MRSSSGSDISLYRHLATARAFFRNARHTSLRRGNNIDIGGLFAPGFISLALIYAHDAHAIALYQLISGQPRPARRRAFAYQRRLIPRQYCSRDSRPQAPFMPYCFLCRSISFSHYRSLSSRRRRSQRCAERADNAFILYRSAAQDAGVRCAKECHHRSSCSAFVTVSPQQQSGSSAAATRVARSLIRACRAPPDIFRAAVDSDGITPSHTDTWRHRPARRDRRQECRHFRCRRIPAAIGDRADVAPFSGSQPCCFDND